MHLIIETVVRCRSG